jgi:hypothetical protein
MILDHQDNKNLSKKKTNHRREKPCCLEHFQRHCRNKCEYEQKYGKEKYIRHIFAYFCVLKVGTQIFALLKRNGKFY